MRGHSAHCDAFFFSLEAVPAMTERGAITENATAPNGQTPGSGTLPGRPDPLEERVCRLEDAVAVLQDTSRLEERILERVAGRLDGGILSSNAEATGIVVNAGRRLLPAARQTPAAGGEAFSDLPAVLGLMQRPSWLLLDFYREVRAMVRMFFDGRFRVSWMARVVPIVAVTLFFVSLLLIHGITIIGPVLDRLVDVVLVCIVYKVLSREAQRYCQMVASLPPYQGY
jgi:hypothetical protein